VAKIARYGTRPNFGREADGVLHHLGAARNTVVDYAQLNKRQTAEYLAVLEKDISFMSRDTAILRVHNSQLVATSPSFALQALCFTGIVHNINTGAGHVRAILVHALSNNGQHLSKTSSNKGGIPLSTLYGRHEGLLRTDHIVLEMSSETANINTYYTISQSPKHIQCPKHIQWPPT
jgi:hypothetical protein